MLSMLVIVATHSPEEGTGALKAHISADAHSLPVKDVTEAKNPNY